MGLGEIYNSRERRDTKKVWYARQSGKAYLYTPEQFTEEWDWFAGAPAADGTRTAGNYREAMNLWQMGWVSNPFHSTLGTCRSEANSDRS